MSHTKFDSLPIYFINDFKNLKTFIRIISRDDFTLFHKIDTDGNISCLAWSSDGTLFATGSEKGKVEIYNAKEWLATLHQSGASVQ